jgi:hypothetical protein
VCVVALKVFGKQIKELIVRSFKKIKAETSGFDADSEKKYY